LSFDIDEVEINWKKCTKFGCMDNLICLENYYKNVMSYIADQSLKYNILVSIFEKLIIYQMIFLFETRVFYLIKSHFIHYCLDVGD
jgi:hypothetical protein